MREGNQQQQQQQQHGARPGALTLGILLAILWDGQRQLGCVARAAVAVFGGVWVCFVNKQGGVGGKYV
jgi:hypothetical protein